MKGPLDPPAPNSKKRHAGDKRANERSQCVSCFECILLGPLFSVFMVLQWSHLSLATSYRIERVLKFEFLSKKFGPYAHTVNEVHDSGLFWEWLESVINETLAVQTDELGKTLPQSEWGFLVQFNKVIGGIRLVQERGSKMPCAGKPNVMCYGLEPDTQSFGLQPCLSNGTGAQEGRMSNCYYPKDYVGVVNTDIDEAFALDSYTGHFEMWLDTREPRHILQKRVEYLEDRHWIDKQTREVVVEIFLRNDQFEPLLSEVRFMFEFDRTGYIHEYAQVETIPANPYSDNRTLKIGLGTAYVLWNTILGIFFLVGRVAKGQSFCNLADKHVLMANVAEALSIAVAASQIALWAIYVPMVGGVLARIEALQRPSDLPFHNNTDEALWQDYHHGVADIEKRTQDAIVFMRWLRELGSFTLVCVLLRQIRIWEGIPAFAAVSRTLSLSAVRLGAVLLSAVTLVSIFAGAAMLNYGTHLEQFHNMQRAVQETAVIAMTGEPAVYEDMNHVDPIFAALWFWALIAVMFMVVLNMILGILVDAANSAANERAAKKDTVSDVSLREQLTLTLKSVSSLNRLFGRSARSYSSQGSDQDVEACEPAAYPEQHLIALGGQRSSWRDGLNGLEQSSPAHADDDSPDIEATQRPWATVAMKGSVGPAEA